MSGPLKNTRHERFCQESAKGKSTDEAYVLAGFKANRGNAARLKANEDVRGRILELQERAAHRTEITAADIAKQLDDDRTFARSLKQSAAAVTATMGKAKVLGLIVDKTEQRLADDQLLAVIGALRGDPDSARRLLDELEA